MTEPLAPARVKKFDYLDSPEEIKHSEAALEKTYRDLIGMWQQATLTTTTMVDEMVYAINHYLAIVRPTEDAWYIPCPAEFPAQVAVMVATCFRNVGWQADYLPHLTNIPIFYLELV